MLRTAFPLLAPAMMILLPEAAPAQLRAGPASESASAAVVTSSTGGSVGARLSPAGAPRALRGSVSASALAPATAGGSKPSLAPVLQARDRGGVPFMVAGGALFVAGAVIGGDAGTLLMVGGAGVGAYGLYLYFGGS